MNIQSEQRRQKGVNTGDLVRTYMVIWTGFFIVIWLFIHVQTDFKIHQKKGILQSDQTLYDSLIIVIKSIWSSFSNWLLADVVVFVESVLQSFHFSSGLWLATDPESMAAGWSECGQQGPAVLKMISPDSPDLWSVAAVIFASRMCLEDRRLHSWFWINKKKK